MLSWRAAYPSWGTRAQHGYQIKAILEKGRGQATRQVNATIIRTYWEIGRLIVENEQDGELRSQYGKKLLTELSRELSSQLERGFSRSNLSNMRLFYLRYPIIQTVSG